MDAVGADLRRSVDGVSREAGVSARHLGRPFRAETGVTPGQHALGIAPTAYRARFRSTAAAPVPPTASEGSAGRRRPHRRS